MVAVCDFLPQYVYQKDYDAVRVLGIHKCVVQELRGKDAESMIYLYFHTKGKSTSTSPFPLFCEFTL